jgi:hypothetical protein
LTDEDLDRWIEDTTALLTEGSGATPTNVSRSELEPHIPDRKPLFDLLVTDDENRLWARRVVPDGALPRYDVFDVDGMFLGAVHVPLDLIDRYAPVIRNGRLYAIATDSLDVPYVTAGPVPALRARR